jgi:hypothetical protein
VRRIIHRKLSQAWEKWQYEAFVAEDLLVRWGIVQLVRETLCLLTLEFRGEVYPAVSLANWATATGTKHKPQLGHWPREGNKPELGHLAVRRFGDYPGQGTCSLLGKSPLGTQVTVQVALGFAAGCTCRISIC